MQPWLSRRDRWGWRSHQKLISNVLEGCIRKFECKKDNEFHFSSPDFFEGIPPFACKFSLQSQYGHLLAAADEDGKVVIYDTNRCGPDANIKEWSAHRNAIFDVAWAESDPLLATASGDQTAALWDMRTSTRLSTFKQHRCSLKSVSFQPMDRHTLATGARDGSIMIWDDRCNRRGNDPGHHVPISVIPGAHIDETKVRIQPKRRNKNAPSPTAIDSSHSVSAVLFQTENILVSAGAADGIVKMWDIRKIKPSRTSAPPPLHQFPYSGSSKRKRGFSSLVLSSTRTKLFASCTDSVIYEYDLCGVPSSEPVSRYKGHMNSTFFVKSALSPDDLFLLSGSSDNLAYVWQVGEPKIPPVVLMGHEAEVTSVAWCPRDFTKVVTCSDDNTLRIWTLSSNSNYNDNEGPNQIIGTAKVCEQPIQDQSPAKSETPSSSQGSNSSSQSSCDSNNPTPTTETGESTQTPLQSPVPSSSKKRRFSLRDWVTTSPRLNSPSSTAKDESSRPDSPLASDKQAGVDSAKQTFKADTSAVECDETVNGKENVKTNSENTDSQKENATDFVEKSCTKDKSARKELFDTRQGVLCNLQTMPVVDVIANNTSTSQTELNRNESLPPDKENQTLGTDNEACESESVNSISNHRSTQRSPLRDDVYMNGAMPTSSVVPSLSETSNTKIGVGKAVPDLERRSTDLKKMLKDKKSGAQMQQAKRRNSIGTIDGYFQPLPKRHKSETR